VAEYLQLVQGARLRLIRVTNTSCPDTQANQLVRDRFATAGGTCYGPLSPATLSTAPFGPPDNPTKYRFTTGLGSSIAGRAGWGVEDYGTGGFTVYLPSDRPTAQQVRRRQLLRAGASPGIRRGWGGGVGAWGRGRGGIAARVLLEAAPSAHPQIVDTLLADRFFDDQFRALAVDFNLFNAGTNLVTIVRFVVELLPTGLFLQR
jgi:hypothetical protein